MVEDTSNDQMTAGRTDGSAVSARDAFAMLLKSYHESVTPTASLTGLLDLATAVTVEADQILTQQFAQARTFYFLLTGRVRFQIQLEEGNEDLDVGTSVTPWTPVGWSGFRAPGRYATTVVTVEPSQLLRFDSAPLRAYVEDHPDAGTLFFEAVLANSLELLATMRERLARVVPVPANFAHVLKPQGEEEAYHRAPPPLSYLLRRSPFFQELDESHLETLAEGATGRYFCRGEPVLTQGSTETGIWVLATGRVAQNYRPRRGSDEVALRTVSTPGVVVAWAGVAGITTHAISVVATRDCTLYRLALDGFESALRDDPALTLALTRRLLWAVSVQLRDARALFISRQFEQEIVAIRNLLEQSCTQLSVGSPLHRLPHLLQSAYTLSDAFACLAHVADSADTVERGLAHLCIDMLGEVRREHEFFEALRRVYHDVVTAPTELPALQVRKRCTHGFREAFAQVRYLVDGVEHLPQDTGHIFVFNHLKNHEYNTLPNNFQLTLDSHFVSAVILDPRYGDGGIRVVRQSRGTEYGHQSYYDRLGHLSVYTPESDELVETLQQRRARQDQFFDAAGRYLQAGVNLIISPEGTSYWTEDSPGPFRPGAFRLALSVSPEAWIVPIAVANFDRRVHSTVYAAVIKPPFRVSDVIREPEDPEQLRAFLVGYQHTYRGYVEEARQLAAQGGHRA